MKVRILSGNALGQIVDMSVTEAEVNIATGFAEAVLDDVVEVAVEVAPVQPAQASRVRRESKTFGD